MNPTCTGLNLTLAKGENRLGQIFDIIIRNRTKPYAWGTDVSKLYNQLYLEKYVWPLSLFLYHDSLDSKVEQETWVMLRAWYGISPTGVQADYALVKLAEMCGAEFPIAKDCLKKNRYVDNIPTGDENEEGREEQIRQVYLS